MPWLHYSQGNSLQYSLDRRLSGPQSHSGCCGVEKNRLSLTFSYMCTYTRTHAHAHTISLSLSHSHTHTNTHIRQEVLGRTNLLTSLIRHGPYYKWRVQQFSYCCVRIRCRGNVSTELLPGNDKGISTEPLPSNDKRIHRHTYTQTQTATWYHKPTLFFVTREVG
jgi:hypothetical protein